MFTHAVESGLDAAGHETVVLIHGLAGTLHLWDRVVPRLETRFHVLRYDLRGHGKSDLPDGEWSLDDFVGDLVALLDSRGIAAAHVVGFSLGGLIVQKLALDHPERVKRLVILSAIAGRTEEEREKVRQRLRNVENDDVETNIALGVERWFSPEFRRNHPDLVQQRIDTYLATNRRGYLNAHRVFVTSDLADELHRIDRPTLVMTGEFDPGSNARMARFMHQAIAGASLEILPGLRHAVLVEAPQVVAEKLDAFLR